MKGAGFSFSFSFKFSEISRYILQEVAERCSRAYLLSRQRKKLVISQSKQISNASASYRTQLIFI